MGFMILTDVGHIALAESIMAQDMHLAWGDLPPYLPAPANLNGVAGASGVLPASSYTYQVTAINPEGETTPSTPVTVVTGSNGSAALNWQAVSGATGYNIYGRTSDNLKLIGSTNAATLTFTDTGVATLGTASPPLTNTTSAGQWTNAPANPKAAHYQLYNELGRRKVLLKKYVNPDDQGEYVTSQGRWSESLVPTKHIFVQVSFDLTDAATNTIYQFGLFLSTVPTPGNENQYYLTPAMIANPGIMLALENTPPIFRNASTREVHEIVMTF